MSNTVITPSDLSGRIHHRQAPTADCCILSMAWPSVAWSLRVWTGRLISHLILMVSVASSSGLRHLAKTGLR